MKPASKESQQVASEILAALQAGPKTTPELRVLVSDQGPTMRNAVSRLLREGKISRREISKTHFRYYIGQTSGVPYAPVQRVKPPMAYRVPVTHVMIEGMRVTLPALPGVAA